MVPFAGWSMPVQYKDGISTSHLHTRFVFLDQRSLFVITTTSFVVWSLEGLSPILIFISRGGGYSHKMGYAYARTARVWFLPISVLERVEF